MSKCVEIRSYNLKHGKHAEFDRVFTDVALPLLRRWKTDVVAWGPSLHDEDSYYLIRAYETVADRQTSQDAFYGSDDWRKGPRNAVILCIESYTTIVLQMDDATVEGLRKR